MLGMITYTHQLLLISLILVFFYFRKRYGHAVQILLQRRTYCPGWWLVVSAGSLQLSVLQRLSLTQGHVLLGTAICYDWWKRGIKVWPFQAQYEATLVGYFGFRAKVNFKAEVWGWTKLLFGPAIQLDFSFVQSCCPLPFSRCICLKVTLS